MYTSVRFLDTADQPRGVSFGQHWTLPAAAVATALVMEHMCDTQCRFGFITCDTRMYV
jgi:hypothetical protein